VRDKIKIKFVVVVMLGLLSVPAGKNNKTKYFTFRTELADMTERTPPSLSTTARVILKPESGTRTLSHGRVRMMQAMTTLDELHLQPADLLATLKSVVSDLDEGLASAVATLTEMPDVEEWCEILTLWIVRPPGVDFEGNTEVEGRSLHQERQKELEARLRAAGAYVGRCSLTRRSMQASPVIEVADSDDSEVYASPEPVVEPHPPQRVIGTNPKSKPRQVDHPAPAVPVAPFIVDITQDKILLDPLKWGEAINRQHYNADRMRDALLTKYGQGKDAPSTHALKGSIRQLHSVFLALAEDPDLLNNAYLVESQRRAVGQLLVERARLRNLGADYVSALSETLNEDDLPAYLQSKMQETRDKVKARQFSKTDMAVSSTETPSTGGKKPPAKKGGKQPSNN